MNLILAVFAILFMVATGFIVIKVFNFLDNLYDFEKLPYAFGLGAGLCAFQLYLYSRLHIKWDIFQILLPWLVFFVVGFVTKKRIPKFTFKSLKLVFVEKFLLALNLLLVMYVTIESILRPVVSWDGWSTWLMRAKMFFVDGGVTPHTFSYVPSEYPVIVSLMSTFVYIFLGMIDDRMVLLLYPAFYVFLGAMFFFALRRIINQKTALVFTFLLLSLQNVIRHSGRFEAGQADVILGFYAFTTTLLLMSFLRRKGLKDLIMLQIFLVITFFIKDDGMPLVILMETMTIFAILKSGIYRRLLTIIIFLVPVVEWQFFKSSLHLYPTPSFIGSEFHLNRFFIIIWEFGKEFLNIVNWNILWPAFFVSFVLFTNKRQKNNRLLIVYLIVFFQIFIYGFVFFFTTPDPHFHIPNVINRSFLHIAPIAMFAVAINTAIIRGKLKDGKI